MKSKLKFYLSLYALLFGVLKLVQFSMFFYVVLLKVIEEECSGNCFIESSELLIISILYLLLALFIYGVSKVNLNWKIWWNSMKANVVFCSQSNRLWAYGWLFTHFYSVTTCSCNTSYDWDQTAPNIQPTSTFRSRLSSVSACHLNFHIKL